MILHLPNHSFTLDEELNSQARLERVEEVLNKNISFSDKEMTVKEYLSLTFSTVEGSKIALDILGYYLSKKEI